ncbi:MAG: branched-chain amino acid transport system substrate-binding protein [Gaiellaceae bacterium]|nr:branched-chain amino acid transport system substrate-binding protein [Gaiellaceae bacterium]MDX6488251.1 branched-chain amino acid transport system substrate-binding protein [Gaiellaceae bacterium]MDX6493383.1 branched-chain amino acid transport system substrate-binding protein [Gaiellaceae bacterium]MDX6518398.1 branched-chain amino acid transport system substrate-binding protein [Gaiellaceae bacterium]MDX6542789.1 branched-chain amino acid transport system substrate-binding protein [Gaiell
MKRPTRWGVLAALVVGATAIAAVAGTTGGHAATAAKKPIVIGWAFDSKGNMAPFDNPALAAAKIRVAQINAKGGVGGAKLQITTCDTQNNDPAKAKSCAASLLGAGAKIIFTTCDVDYATPVVQEAINRGILAIAPCIGTDQMGPKRFGAKGKLAFSFGNVAQDEGSAMAEYAHRRGWKTASLATNTLLVYFKNVVTAFDKRFTQLGGKIVTRQSYATGANNVGNAVTQLNAKKADVIVSSTSFGELPALVSGLRALGNNTPVLNSWAGDGTYWVTQNPKITNYYCVTYASVFGDDPNKAVRAMIASLKKAGAAPGTGGFVGGAAAIDGVALAIQRAHGSTKGSALAAQLLKFKKVQVLGGKISFSAQFHTVYGRQYRVIQIQNNKAKYVGAVTAKVIPKL